ncbi:eCIS core domain-containing protein [Mucilaginibacter lappiensis]|uniref:eCIS core domain-containing protein n=1 Tax=Mucilaginibacter lappiensis TaxID=354630 RepID=A0A841JH05_9SPHI|nr:DUF4157 domain-containing protein [Mucilaginibacter lappiensis]MBB6127735.1 hypothetical protein [Mucilaginibacter lappiensis]
MSSFSSKNNEAKVSIAPPGSVCKPFFQPKLTVNQPNDIYEQEADAMADQVMRMATPNHSEKAFFKPVGDNIQRKCQHCEEEEKVHRKESLDTETPGNHGLDSYVGSLGASGQSIPKNSRSFFEPRFGHDFSNVRIHTDSVAAKSAQSINALAYTTGNNIVFNSGQYSPESDSGKRLMAHELTHVVQQDNSAKKIQRKTGETDTTGKQIEDMLMAHSFETEWKNFTEYTDSMMRGMYAETPAYMDLQSGGSPVDPLYNTNREQALALVDDLFIHLRQSDVDAYKYGMDFSRRLKFLNIPDRATEAEALYQQGWQFVWYLKKPEDTTIAVDYAPDPTIPLNDKKDGVPTAVIPPPGTDKTKDNQPVTTNNDKGRDMPTEPALLKADEKLVDAGTVNRLSFEDDLIVKLPYLNFLKVAKGKQYFITGSVGRAMVNGKMIFGYNNFVIIQDLEALSKNMEKYYVAALATQGAVYDGEANFSSSDFKTDIISDSKEKPKIPAIWNRLDSTRNMRIIDVVLQDIDIYPKEIDEYLKTKVLVGTIKNEFTASPDLAKEIFDETDTLIKQDKKSEAADKLATLTEAAFSFLSFDKKLEYIELLTNEWTWEAREKAIVEIFKSVSSIDELNKIKATLKGKKLWDGSTMWDKMFADLDSQYWSLLVAVGMKFSSTPYTLSEFSVLLWNYVRNVSMVGVFINTNGEPEVIPNALKEIESSARGAINFIEGIWDGIVMLVSHPDKIIEGVAQMVNLILNMQLVQIGYPPAIEFVGKVFGQISKQIVAGVRGLALMDAEDVVIKKVKWAIIWEVASWFIGVGEIKAALKGVQIGGMTEKLLAVARVFSRVAGFGKIAVEEAEMVSRFERLAGILVKESKVLKSEEEAMTLISKLEDKELEKLVMAMEKSEIKEGTSLAQLAKDSPELEGLVNKVESMEKLANADNKVAFTETEIRKLQNLVAEESDPLFQKLLDKEEQIFNEKVKGTGNVMEVAEKELQDAYDVEVKVGDHTYRRSIEDGTWCRFSVKKCNIPLDNSAVNKQKPKRINSGTEPVPVVPFARGYAIEDIHLRDLAKDGWSELPNYFPSIDGTKAGAGKNAMRKGLPIKNIEGAEVLSIKSTSITDPELLKTNMDAYLKALQRNTFSNGELFVRNVTGKNLHLIFEQGFLSKVDNKEVFKALKEMGKTAKAQGVNFEWFVIPANGKIMDGPEFFKAQKALIDAL